MALTNDCGAIRMHGDADSRDVDSKEGAAALAGKDAFGFDCLAVPAVKPEDPVGLRDRVPALEIGELAAMGLTGADIAMTGLRRSACSCRAEKPITVSSRSRPALGLRG